ncbi:MULTISPECIES: hypothetical protein [Achromobacter]|uniref:Lipoprotein n=2 Tax=Achromobacter piechaudii TaxID=72556 RepID=A0A6S7EP25_9BURK|nr:MULTISPECIES: hypothetical protein [Achromobacter]EFF75834.1 hypothetical protein HMPREF0004_2895 [Achromobacter piechaudii ATCC 43553]KNY10494.1 hypothetical protein AKG08_12370 [Achromobacter piechaudii]MPS79442.1 hypothetical protein [Achromobacter sp.]CAB3920213.1 hypothetical protein LMG1861_05347 [Achromobacter piechaudii]
MSKSLILRGVLRAGAVLMLTATLAACGGDDGDGGKSDNGAGTPGNGGTETPVTPPTPAKPELRCAP